jgi:hypothetical protein
VRRERVTELHYTPRTSSSEDSSGDVYNPIVEFRAQDGMEYSFRHTIGSNPASYSVGEEVEVLYDPAKPEDSATINSFRLVISGLAYSGFYGRDFLHGGRTCQPVFAEKTIRIRRCSGAAEAGHRQHRTTQLDP